jgi:hypothetical protein
MVIESVGSRDRERCLICVELFKMDSVLGLKGETYDNVEEGLTFDIERYVFDYNCGRYYLIISVVGVDVDWR